jgi:hypothetical protein
MQAVPSDALTDVHVLISLIGIVAGAVIAIELLRGRATALWTGLFLGATILTSVTGFVFRSANFGPPHVVGAISLVVLALACVAFYWKEMRGPWQRVFIVTALLALYLNVFVGVVQAFGKIPALKALAPTQTEPPFLVAQAATLAVFAALTVAAARTANSQRA